MFGQSTVRHIPEHFSRAMHISQIGLASGTIIEYILTIHEEIFVGFVTIAHAKKSLYMRRVTQVTRNSKNHF